MALMAPIEGHRDEWEKPVENVFKFQEAASPRRGKKGGGEHVAIKVCRCGHVKYSSVDALFRLSSPLAGLQRKGTAARHLPQKEGLAFLWPQTMFDGHLRVVTSPTKGPRL